MHACDFIGFQTDFKRQHKKSFAYEENISHIQSTNEIIYEFQKITELNSIQIDLNSIITE